MNHDQTATTKPHKENQSRAKLGLKSRKSSRLPTCVSRERTPTIKGCIVTDTNKNNKRNNQTENNINKMKKGRILTNPYKTTKQEKNLEKQTKK